MSAGSAMSEDASSVWKMFNGDSALRLPRRTRSSWRATVSTFNQLVIMLGVPRGEMGRLLRGVGEGMDKPDEEAEDALTLALKPAGGGELGTEDDPGGRGNISLRGTAAELVRF